MCLCLLENSLPLVCLTNACVSFESYGLVVILILENLMSHHGVHCSHLYNIR